MMNRLNNNQSHNDMSKVCQSWPIVSTINSQQKPVTYQAYIFDKNRLFYTKIIKDMLLNRK